MEALFPELYDNPRLDSKWFHYLSTLLTLEYLDFLTRYIQALVQALPPEGVITQCSCSEREVSFYDQGKEYTLPLVELAEALRREPVVNPVDHSLLSEPVVSLLQEQYRGFVDLAKFSVEEYIASLYPEGEELD